MEYSSPPPGGKGPGNDVAPLSTGMIFDILRRFGIIPCESDKLKSLVGGFT